MNKAHLKTMLGCSRILEFILVVQVFMTTLLIASTTSLAMPGVELYKAGKRYRELYGKGKPFDVNDVFLSFALSLVFYFIMFALLLACTGNLVPRAVDLGKLQKIMPSTYRPFVASLSVALVFGFLSCIALALDMVLQYKLLQTQRAQETQPNKRRNLPIDRPGISTRSIYSHNTFSSNERNW
nr:uncharacterized protein LOC131772170 [Pocillopora verrucosa]